MTKGGFGIRISDTGVNMNGNSQVKRLNVGCGDVPTEGWVNYDNSLAIRLAHWPFVPTVMGKLGWLTPRQQRYIKMVREIGIKYANAVKHIPEADNSVEVLYTCHMIEHLNRSEAEQFLREAHRVLAPNGIIRVALPDLRFHVENYLKDDDADAFIENLYMASPKVEGFSGKLKYLLVGERHHLWMYDGDSLCRLLKQAGFQNPRVVKAGETMIANPGKLDLAERYPESVFAEAIKHERFGH